MSHAAALPTPSEAAGLDGFAALRAGLDAQLEQDLRAARPRAVVAVRSRPEPFAESLRDDFQSTLPDAHELPAVPSPSRSAPRPWGFVGVVTLSIVAAAAITVAMRHPSALREAVTVAAPARVAAPLAATAPVAAPPVAASPVAAPPVAALTVEAQKIPVPPQPASVAASAMPPAAEANASNGCPPAQSALGLCSANRAGDSDAPAGTFPHPVNPQEPKP
jgi:hypothetical protein